MQLKKEEENKYSTVEIEVGEGEDAVKEGGEGEYAVGGGGGGAGSRWSSGENSVKEGGGEVEGREGEYV